MRGGDVCGGGAAGRRAGSRPEWAQEGSNGFNSKAFCAFFVCFNFEAFRGFCFNLEAFRGFACPPGLALLAPFPLAFAVAARLRGF